ncbi:MAG: hypothetical protein ACFFDN_37700, partial [Candidatus Hodarchaeota archaeon]
MMPKILYIGRQLVDPPVEGYHVVSHRTIQAAVHSKIDPYIVTYEQSEIDNKKLANRYFTVKSIINPLFHTSFLPSI